MKKILLNWLVGSLAVFIAAKLLPGIEASGWISIAILAAVLGFVNAILKPILSFLSIPMLLLSLGLFMVVINGFTLWLSAGLVPGFSLPGGFGAAIGGGIVISICTWVFNGLVGRKKEEGKGN